MQELHNQEKPSRLEGNGASLGHGKPQNQDLAQDSKEMEKIKGPSQHCFDFRSNLLFPRVTCEWTDVSLFKLVPFLRPSRYNVWDSASVKQYKLAEMEVFL